MRLYSFVCFYLSSIQQGIQTGHMAVDLVRRYRDNNGMKHDVQSIVSDWADNHKTFIVLNGGDSDNILAIHDQIRDLSHKLNLPYCHFNEPGCIGMTTCVGVVVPEKYYEAKKSSDYLVSDYVYLSKNGERIAYNEDTPEYEFIELIRSYPLAR